jgi:hypothetical protein
VPRAKYRKTPEPLPAIEQVHRSNFRFREEQWRQLTKCCRVSSPIQKTGQFRGGRYCVGGYLPSAPAGTPEMTLLYHTRLGSYYRTSLIAMASNGANNFGGSQTSKKRSKA